MAIFKIGSHHLINFKAMRPGLRDEKSVLLWKNEDQSWTSLKRPPKKQLSKLITNESEVPGLRQTHSTERSGGDENS